MFLKDMSFCDLCASTLILCDNGGERLTGMSNSSVRIGMTADTAAVVLQCMKLPSKRTKNMPNW
jgi:hypothetical protein